MREDGRELKLDEALATGVLGKSVQTDTDICGKSMLNYKTVQCKISLRRPWTRRCHLRGPAHVETNAESASAIEEASEPIQRGGRQTTALVGLVELEGFISCFGKIMDQLTGSALWPSGVVGRLEGVVLTAFNLEGVLRDVRLVLHPVLAHERPSLYAKK